MNAFQIIDGKAFYPNTQVIVDTYGTRNFMIKDTKVASLSVGGYLKITKDPKNLTNRKVADINKFLSFYQIKSLTKREILKL